MDKVVADRLRFLRNEIANLQDFETFAAAIVAFLNSDHATEDL